MAQIKSLSTGIKFKDTSIGKIPVDWDVQPLIKAVGNVNDLIVAGPFGSNLKVEDYRDEGVPIIRLQNIETCKFVNKDIKHISIQKAKELSYHSFKKGDIVLAKLGMPIGKTCIIPDSMKDGIVVADVVRIHVDEHFSDKRYIMYALNSVCVLNQLNKGIVGTTRPRVNLGQVRNLLIPIPPISEQKKIAEILTTVDDAIEETGEIIKKTRQLKKGLMQRLLTQGIGHKKFKKTEIGEIPIEWKVLKLKELYKSPIRDFGSFSMTKLVKYVAEGVPFLRSDNFKDGRFVPQNILHINDTVHKKLTKSMIKKGDLLFTKIGNIGHADIYDGSFGECNSNATIAKIDIDENKAFSHYVRWILNSTIASKQYDSKIISTPPRINLGEISNLKIPLPIISEQKKVVSILNNLEVLMLQEEYERIQLDSLKASLMQILLTGKIRVKFH